MMDANYAKSARHLLDQRVVVAEEPFRIRESPLVLAAPPGSAAVIAYRVGSEQRQGIEQIWRKPYAFPEDSVHQRSLFRGSGTAPCFLTRMIRAAQPVCNRTRNRRGRSRRRRRDYTTVQK